MINYTAIVTLEECKYHGYTSPEAYIRAQYPNVIFESIEKFGNNYHVKGYISITEYKPILGKQWETTDFETIRQEIDEQFS